MGGLLKNEQSRGRGAARLTGTDKGSGPGTSYSSLSLSEVVWKVGVGSARSHTCQHASGGGHVAQLARRKI